MEERPTRRIVLLACVALSACGGGGARGAAVPATSSPIAQASGKGSSTLSIRITVPQKTSSTLTRNPAYVAATTQSVAVIVTPSGGTATAPQLIACSAGTCSGGIGAPAGNDAITVKLYDQPSGAGNILSTGSASVSAGANTATNVNLTFNPVVSTYSFAASGSFTAGTAASVNVSAVAYDPDGNTIVGPGTYVDSSGNPVTITLTGMTESGGDATLSLSGNKTFAGPSSAAATLSYNGNSSYGATAFTGTSSPARGMLASSPVAVNGYKITEFLTPSGAGSNPCAPRLGPDGNIWFDELGANLIARITTNGTITEFTITGSWANLEGLTVGPDGRIWFAEGGLSKIGRINTDGTGYVEFNAPGGSQPIGPVVGPDGNIWFTDAAHNALDAMSTSGVMVHNYTAGFSATALSNTNDYQRVTIIGPDGNLWVAEQTVNKLARVTTSGAVTEFAQPADAGLWGVAIGPDGNIWGVAGSTVTVTNTSGTVLHTYGYPTDALLSTASLGDLVLGKDGNLWLQDWADDMVESLSVNNSASLYSNGVSATSNLCGVAIGADGNVYLPEANTGKIAKLVY